MKQRKKFLITSLVGVLMFAFTITASASVIGVLTKSLNDAGVSEPGRVVEHLKKVKINKHIISEIKENINNVQMKLKGVNEVTDIKNVSNDDVTVIANEMMDSAKLLKMNLKFVDKDDNEVNLTNKVSNGIKIELTDLDGKLLTTVDPNKGDLKNISSVAHSLNKAVKKVQVLSKTNCK